MTRRAGRPGSAMVALARGLHRAGAASAFSAVAAGLMAGPWLAWARRTRTPPARHAMG